MKKFFFRILSLIVLSSVFFSQTVIADDVLEEAVVQDVIDVSVETSIEPKIYSKHVLVIDRKTDTILYEKNAYDKTAMASTTKIMTAIIVLERCNLKEDVVISKKAAGTGGSTLGITSNTKMTIESLLYGLMLRSGNDCAVALAEHIGGSVEGFAKIMNEKALELNLANTNFVTPHGLDSDKHFTTAYDLACLTKYALENEIFRKIVKTKQTTIMVGNYSRTINNTHELLGNTEGVYGVKTGFTGNAGRCLVTAVNRNDLDIIIVVLGADTKKIRTEDTLKLINFVFDNFENIDTYNLCFETFEKYFFEYDIKIEKSQEKALIKLEEKDNYIFPINKNDVNKIKTSLYTLSTINAPVEKNLKIGELRVSIDNKILYTLNINIKNNINKNDWKVYLKKCIYSIKNSF